MMHAYADNHPVLISHDVRARGPANLLVPPAVLRCCVCNLTVAGEARFRFDDAQQILPRGHLLIMAPGCRRVPSVRAGSTWRSERLAFAAPPSSDIHGLLRQLLPTGTRLCTTDQQIIGWYRTCFRELHELQRQPPNPSRDRLRWHLVAGFLLRLEHHRHLMDAAPEDPCVHRALRLIHDHLDHHYSVPELAHRCGLARSRFSERFSAATGLPPLQYMERCRLQQAADQLRSSSLPIHTIAADLGYEDARYFTRRFRTFAGSTPREFRQQV